VVERRGHGGGGSLYALGCTLSACRTTSMGIDFHLISNFLALALITLAGPAVIFILFYRRGAL
jgi:hypothetical protein